MQSHVVQRFIIAIVFSFLIPATVWWGVHVVSPYPDYSIAYENFKKENKEQIDEIEKKAEKSKGRNTAYAEIDKMWEVSPENINYMKDQNRYNKIMLFSTSIIGFAVLILGGMVQLPVIGAGFILAGTICFTRAQFHQDDMKLFLCLVLTIALFTMLSFAYKSSKE